MQKVLVVDDEPDFVLSLTTLLRTEGYDTRGLHELGSILRHESPYRSALR